LGQKSIEKKKNIFLLLQLVSVIICIALFILLMLDSYEKYTKKMTNIGVGSEILNKEQTYPPCITICPIDAFRKRGFFYRKDEFQKQTFKKEEIFHTRDYSEASEAIVFNESIFSIEEIQSVFLGRCFVVCQKVLLSEYSMSYFVIFKRSMDIKG